VDVDASREPDDRVARNTIDKLLVDLGTECSRFQDAALRNLDVHRVEADEIWWFTYAKAENVPEQFQGEYGFGDT
jgi:hypothetical protein